MRTPKVLFLCTGNSARSQMGEGFLRRYAGERFEVHSAGLEPKGVNPYTIRAMDEIGIDIRDQASTPLRDCLGRKAFRYLIVVCSHAEKNCPTIWPGQTERLYWPFDDPAAATGTDEEIMAVFRRVRDEIDEKVRAWLAEREITAEA
jgi:arsenate reductase